MSDTNAMQTITIQRYDAATAGYVGYIEPEDKRWIVYVGADGAPLFYPHRFVNGAVACEGVGAHNVARNSEASGGADIPCAGANLSPHLRLAVLVAKWLEPAPRNLSSFVAGSAADERAHEQWKAEVRALLAPFAEELRDYVLENREVADLLRLIRRTMGGSPTP